MTIEWLIRLLEPLLLGFVIAVLNCIVQKHGFSMDCVYEGLGVISVTLGVWLKGLFQAPPGKVIVTMGSEAAAGAAKDAEIAAKKVANAGPKNSGLDF